MLHALKVLAEVYRAGRELWPATSEGTGQTITLEIGQLKSLEVTKLHHCDAQDVRAVWALVRKNQKEASVELLTAPQLTALNREGCIYQALDLSPSDRSEYYSFRSADGHRGQDSQ